MLSGGLCLTSHLIKISSIEHDVMRHSRRRVVVHTTSVPFTKVSLRVSIGSFMIVMAATVHWASRWRLKIHAGISSVEHIGHIFGRILLDLNVISIDFYLQINHP